MINLMSRLVPMIALSTAFWLAVPSQVRSEVAIRRAAFLPAVHIHQDLGGSVVAYARKVSLIRKKGRMVQISGRCDSACTLFLALPPSQICINPGASFGFHRAYGSTKFMNDWGTQYLQKSYPKWVNNWLRRKGGLNNSVKRVSFATASRHVARCESRVFASK